MKKIFIVGLLYLSSCSKTDVNSLALGNESLIKSGDIVVLNGGENSLSIIDPISLTERKRHYLELNVQGFAHHLHLSPSKEKLSIALPDYDFSQGHDEAHKSNKAGAILEVNTKEGTISKIIQVGAVNHNAIFNNDESEIWTSLIKEAGRIEVYDAKSSSLIKSISLDTEPTDIIFAQNSKYGITANAEGNFLNIIDSKSKTVIKQIKVDLYPTEVALGASEDQIFVINDHVNSLNIVDLNVLKVIEVLDFNFKPGYILSIKDELWVTAPELQEIKIFKKSNGEWKNTSFIKTEKDPHHLASFDNNKKTVVVNQLGNSVMVFDSETKMLLKRISVGSKPNAVLIR